MNIQNCLNVGLKLLGVYFVVLGLTAAAITVINFAIQSLEAAFQRDDVFYVIEGPVISLISAAQPLAYLVCGFILTRKTEWCLKLIGYPPEGT